MQIETPVNRLHKDTTNRLHRCTHNLNFSATYYPCTAPKPSINTPSHPHPCHSESFQFHNHKTLTMARLAIIGSLLMFLLALTEASIYRTTITTEVNDQSETCQRQLSQVSMNSCIRYLEQPYMSLSRADVSQVQQQCCQELGQVNRECRCEAVRQIVQAITGSQGQQQQQQQQMEEVIRIAQQLPNRCGMEPQYCHVQQEEIREPQESEMCQKQLSHTRINSCIRYLQPHLFIPSIVHQQLCCLELGQVNRDCRCEAVRQIVQTITGSQGSQQQGQKQQQQMEKVIRKAHELPNMCGMEPQYCRIQQQGYGELNTRQSEMCQSQLGQTRMNSCKRYLQPYILLPGVDVTQLQQQCCQELGQVSRDCRCEALKQTVQAISGPQGSQQQGQEQQQQMEEVLRTAQQLPNMCGMEPQYCHIQQETY